MKLYSLQNLTAPRDYKIQIVEQTDSTNDHLFRLAQQSKAENLILLAHSQTSGKGSKNRQFFSPEGGIYLSILLQNLDLSVLPRITPMAAVALYEAILPFAEKELAIKWVNDIYLDGKKLCGILTENKFLAEKQITVVGVGINLVAPENDFPDGFLHPPTALLDTPDSAVAQTIINTFLKRFFDILEEKVIPPLYKQRCCTLGKEVSLRQGDKIICGKAVDVSENGALLVQLPGGDCRAFTSGEVTSQI